MAIYSGFSHFNSKPSINGPFSMAMLNNQRVYIYNPQFHMAKPRLLNDLINDDQTSNPGILFFRHTQKLL